MFASNSAPQVSTRRYVATTPSTFLCARTSCSVAPVSAARRRSESPALLYSHIVAVLSVASAEPRAASSSAMIDAISVENHGSIALCAKTSAGVAPRRRASPTRSKRSAVGVWMRLSSAALVVPSSIGRSKPLRPISSPRMALPSASAKVRPIAMTSPTDFICVVSVGSVPGNFSNAKRGAFTTT